MPPGPKPMTRYLTDGGAYDRDAPPGGRGNRAGHRGRRDDLFRDEMKGELKWQVN